MLVNYIRTSLRAFLRSKTHTVINVVGLTLGLLGALIILQKVRYEYSFDTYHTDADRIYRIVREDTEFGNQDFDEGVPYPFTGAFRTDFPEAEAVAMVDRNFNEVVVSATRPNGDVVRFKEEDHIAFVDSTYFRLFSYAWIQGDPATALARPHSVVLSESMALKYFGDADPIGRILNFDNAFDLTVTGLVRDTPPNTALPLNILISTELGEAHRRINDNWGSTSSSVQCYVKLPPRVGAASINRRLPEFLTSYRSAEVAATLRYFLQPLREIHFDTRFNALGGQSIISRETLLGFSLIGVFLLVTACINFINLNTVLVFKRAREIGIRKMLGSTPSQIGSYFMTETFLITLAAVLIAFVLAGPVLTAARRFLGEGFTVNPLEDPVLAGAAVLAAVVLTLGSGLYPAFLLSGLHPIVAIRDASGRRPGSFLSLRRGLIVVQFAISQVLIICTLTAVLQMRHLQDIPLGYDTDAVVEFAIPVQDADLVEALEDRLLRNTAVQHATFSNSGASSGNTWGSNFHYEKDDERLENDTQVKLVDTDYVETYRMAIVAGRDFMPSDTATGYIANEAFVRLMGFTTPEEALETPIEVWGYDPKPLLGVVRDFNTNSLHESIEATILIPTLQYAYVGAARINAGQLRAALDHIQASWEATYPDFIFESIFLDDRIAEFYEDEQTLQSLMQAFALLAVLIGCIGLFGLISYTTSQRSREVGIRKVLGASVTHIVGLFTREFVLFVILGFGVAGPAAYYIMTRWLERFAYRIDMGTSLYLTAFFISLGIALLTVGFKTYRTAMTNPVDVMRGD